MLVNRTEVVKCDEGTHCYVHPFGTEVGNGAEGTQSSIGD